MAPSGSEANYISNTRMSHEERCAVCAGMPSCSGFFRDLLDVVSQTEMGLFENLCEELCTEGFGQGIRSNLFVSL